MGRRSSFSAIRVGALITVAIALTAFAIVVIGRGTRFLTGSQMVEAHFNRTNGLQPGAPVTLAGVDIGVVQSIYFPTNPDANYIIVRMWIDRRGKERIRADSRAEIRTMGLLGDKYIELTPGSSGASRLGPEQTLRTENPVDYETILRGFRGSQDLMANILSISVSLRNMTEAIQTGNGLLHELIYASPAGTGELTPALSSVRQSVNQVGDAASELGETLRKINHGKGVAAALLNDRAEGRTLLPNLASSAASIRSTARNLDQIVARYQKAGGAIPQLMLDEAYANELMANVNQSSREILEVVHKINSGQGTLGLLVNDPSLYKQAQTLLGSNPGGFSILGGILGLFHASRSEDAPRQESFGSMIDRKNGAPVAVSATMSAPDK